MKKRFVATLLALCMLLSIVPTSAFAASLDNDAAQPKQETLANDLTGSAKPDDTQGAPDAPKPDGAAPVTDGQDGAPNTPDADTVPDGNGGADKQGNPDADKQDNPGDGADKKDQDKNDQNNVNAVQEGPQQVDVSATAYSPQTVYVYTKVEGNNAGLQVNADGWYTIGKITLNIPTPSRYSQWVKKNDLSPNYIGESGATLTDIENALKTITRYSKNQTIDHTKINWTQLAISNGASDYTDEAPKDKYVWHLDGKISVAFVGSIVYKYYDAATNQLLEGVEPGGEVATPGSHTITTGSRFAKSIPGYTCVGVGNGDGNYSNSTTVTVTAGQPTTVIFYYAPATYSYTVKYVESGSGTELRNRKTGTLNYDQTQLENAAVIPGYQVVGTDAVMISRNNKDITFYYVKDNSQQKTLSYTVKHVVGGEEKFSHTYTEDVWVNDSKITIQADSLNPNTYTGYKFVSITPNVKVGDKVNDKQLITLTYAKDNEQTKERSYTVQHVVDGQVMVDDTKSYTENVWINDSKITIQADSLNPNTYTGYKFVSITPNVKVGDKVDDKQLITLTYAKDNEQTKETQYTVKYTIEGKPQDADTVVVKGTAWVNDNPAMIAIAEGGIPAPANKYEGYKLDPKNDTYPDAGTKVESGAEYTVNYVARTDLTYTVKYLEKGTDKKLHDPKIVDKQTFGAEVTEKAIDITGYDKVEPSEQKFTINADKNEITFYYTARTDLTYTVKYLEKGTGKELAKPKTVENQTFGTAVTEKAIFIKGYWPCNPAKETIIIDVDENVINFYYGPNNNPRFPQVSDDTSSTTNTGALKSPKTGDASNLSLWFALLFVSGGVLMGTAVIGRKRKYNR